MAESSRTKSVNELEREVEAARARVAATLNQLHGPVEEWRNRLKPDSIKAEIKGYATDAVSHTVRSTGRDLRDRALANPIPTAAIGAGLAWSAYRWARSIPAPVVLIGAGVGWLMKYGNVPPADRSGYRDPYRRDQPRGYVPGGVAGYGYPVREDAPGSTARERIEAAATNISHAARETGSEIADAAARAGAAVSHAAETARSAVSDATQSAVSSVTGAVGAVSGMVSGSDQSGSAPTGHHERPGGRSAPDLPRQGRHQTAYVGGREPLRMRGDRHQPSSGSDIQRWALGGLGLAAGVVTVLAMTANAEADEQEEELRRRRRRRKAAGERGRRRDRPRAQRE